MRWQIDGRIPVRRFGFSHNLMIFLLVYIATSAVEWVGPKDGRRPIKVKLHERRKVIEIVSAGSDEKKLRMIDLNTTKKLFFHLAIKDMRFMVIKVPKEYDLVGI